MKKNINLMKGLNKTARQMTSLNAKSKRPVKSWWNKLSKTDKNIVKGTALAIGTVALIGASGKVAESWKSQFP